MMFILRRNEGKNNPDYPVARDEQDCSEEKRFVATPLQPEFLFILYILYFFTCAPVS